MKKLLTLLLSLVATAAFAQTFPVQNLSVYGTTTLVNQPLTVANGGTSASTASGTSLDNITGFSGTGFLTRTGAGTYAFQSLTNGITLPNLTQIVANVVLGNPSNSTANVGQIGMPSCSTSNSALTWTSGTGFGCGNNYALLSGGTFTGNVTLGFSSPLFTLNDTSGSGHGYLVWQKSGTNLWDFASNSSSNSLSIDRYVAGVATDVPFSISNSTGVVTMVDGVAGGTAAASAGNVGELLSASTTGTSLTSGIPANCASKALTAGVWDVTGVIEYVPAGTTTTSGYTTGVSTTSATYQNITGSFNNIQQTFGLSVPAGTVSYQSAPVYRYVLPSGGTAYLVGAASFAVSTMTCNGFIRATRVN